MASLPPAPIGPSLLLLEGGLTLIAVGAAFCCPRACWHWFSGVEKAFGKFARRRGLSILAVTLSAFFARLLILPLSPIPQPVIQDDFSFLLAADTFSSGRLTNATPPMWTHFETFHVTMKPSYMSMYFPAQGMVMAAGKLVAGHPWYGVLASAALMCGAITWMLQGWLPAGWALFGGMLAVLRLALFSYWIDTYTGGAVAAIGGALVLGAVPRLWRGFSTRDFLWMAVGMALLANSRPYEGLLVAIPALIAVCWRVLTQPRPAVDMLIRRIAPAAALLIGTVLFMGYYNYRVFGNVLTPPYAIDRATYASAPHFLWQSPRPEPTYRYSIMREFYTGWELGHFLKSRTLAGFPKEIAMRIVLGILFFLGFALLAPVVMLPRAVRDRRIRFLVASAAVFAAGLVVETWFIPHYLAPFTAGLYAILLQCMRHLRVWRPGGQPSGLFLVRTIPVVCLALAGIRLYAHPLHIEIDGYANKAWYGGTRPFALKRANLLNKLKSFEGQQLAIVRYSPNHSIFDEWVYNAADIDSSKVVWARDMGPAHNSELIRYFKNRRVWLVEADLNPPRLTSYPVDQTLARTGSHASAFDASTPLRAPIF